MPCKTLRIVQTITPLPYMFFGTKINAHNYSRLRMPPPISCVSPVNDTVIKIMFIDEDRRDDKADPLCHKNCCAGNTQQKG